MTRSLDTGDEAGFTLIELLTVVIIIGILGAIAIPQFISRRELAMEQRVASDTRSIALALFEPVLTRRAPVGAFDLAPARAQELCTDGTVAAVPPGCASPGLVELATSPDVALRVTVAADGTYIVAGCSVTLAPDGNCNDPADFTPPGATAYWDSANGGLE